MKNAQNATEIQQRVINLVELYRTKVGKESQVAKDAQAEKKYWDDQFVKAVENGADGVVDMDDIAPVEWVNALRVNDHLLGHFYSVLAGQNAEKEVLSQFLADYYDSSVFTPEEEDFLRSHFKEMVNYIIQTPCDNLEMVNQNDNKDFNLIPTEVLDLIKSRVDIPAGSVIYNPFTGFAQMTSLFPCCKFYCEESYSLYNKRWNAFSKKVREEENFLLGSRDEDKLSAWMKVALYANSVDATVVEDGKIPDKFDSVVSFIPQMPTAIPKQEWELDFDLPDDSAIVNKIMDSYKNLPMGGKMILVLPNKNLWSSNSYYSLRPLWEKMISEKSLAEIIQLPLVMSSNLHHGFCIVISEKGCGTSTVTMVDARFASKSKELELRENLDLKAFKEMLANDGKDDTTGLRKLAQIPVEQVDINCLVPQIYVVERPSQEEMPVPLSELCTFETTLIRDVKDDLPEDTPWIESRDLSTSFNGYLDMNSVKKANCPNNPVPVEDSNDYVFDESGDFIDDHWVQTSKKGFRVCEYRCLTFLDGSTDSVLFALSWLGIEMAIVRAPGKPVAVGERIFTVCPKKGIDVMTLAASLRLPIVLRQLAAFERFGLVNHIDDILVPTDKRIIYDEKKRLYAEKLLYDTYKEKNEAQRTEYINEVRMRKHDMGQYIFELFNIEDLMRYYVENKEKEKDTWRQIEELLDNFRTSLEELSKLLDNLSKEEEFGKPEYFNIDEYLSLLETRHKADGFKIRYIRDELSIRKYNIKTYKKDLASKAMEDAQIKAFEESKILPCEVLDAFYETDAEEMAIHSTNVTTAGLVQKIDDEMPNNKDLIEAQIKAFEDEMILPYEVLEDFYAFEAEKMVVGRSHTDFKDSAPMLYISPIDIQRLVSNIIDNARKHGFTDKGRKDYEIKVIMSIDSDKNMFMIEFCNNGNPLPDGMTKLRYGIKGEKAGKTAGTGIGGSYVKKIAEHYCGDYDIFMKDGWTVVKICLPIK